jgi:mannan endo-1,4-beta-mannosidase
MVCCILLATCCSKKEITQEQIAPELASSVPLNGAVEIANGMQKIELIFNQSIKIANASAIKLNDKSVEKVDVSVNTVIITVMLQPATQYELLILKEAISNTNNATLKADIRILFSTKKIVAHASELITPNSSPEVQKLFQFLKETYGQKVISGTMANVSWNMLRQASIRH